MTPETKTEDATFQDVKKPEDAPFDPSNESRNPDGTGGVPAQDDEMDKLLAELNEEFGEDVVEYGDDDLGAGFVNVDGKYKCFITKGSTTKNVRTKDTKTKQKGSTYHIWKPLLLVKEDIEGKKYGGNLYPSIFFEPGNMRNFEHFCISSKCRVFTTDGRRKYFPQASYEKGGSIGMPIIAEVEMKWEDKVKKSETDGKYYPEHDEEGNVVRIKRSNVIAFYPWDTTERYIAPEETADDIDTGVTDDDLGIDGDNF